MAVRRILYQVLETEQLFKGDAIQHEREWWLVPEWWQGPTAGTLRPARIICLRDLSLSKPSAQYADVDWVLERPLSKEILEGRRLSQSPLVIDRPEIHLRVDTDFHR